MAGYVEFTPTPEDWVAANRLWYGRMRARRVLKWLGIAVLGLATAETVFDVVELDKTPGAIIEDVLPMILFGAIVAAMPFVTFWLIPRQVRRQFLQRPAMADGIRFAWDDESLTGAARTGTTVQHWRELHRQLRDDRSFVFLPTDRMLLLIPRRALSREQADDLAATADRNGPRLG